jgi:hypothetical protein
LIVDGATGAQVYNNILINQHPFRGSIAVGDDAFAGLVSDYNIVIDVFSNDGGDVFLDFDAWQALGYDQNSLLADPINDIFVNPGAGDYHVQEGAQPVDAGNGSLAQGVDTDIEGNSRPSGSEHDIGAYESQIVLALDDEEKSIPVYLPRWMSLEVEGDRIIIEGLQTGDVVGLYTIAGQSLLSVTADDAGVAICETGFLVSGVYLLVVSH